MRNDTTQIYTKNGTERIPYPTVCVSFSKELLQTNGIFQGENPIDYVFPVVLLQVIMPFLISYSLYFLLRPLRQPKFVCNILAGIILGPSVLGRNKTFFHAIFPAKEMLVFNTFSAFGSAYYAFMMAVKMDIGIFMRSASNAWIISISSYFIPFMIINYSSNSILNRTPGCIKGMPRTILSNALATTYFPIVAHVMEELELTTTELGRLVMSCAVLIELFSHGYAIVAVTLVRGDIISAIESLLVFIAPIIFVLYVAKPMVLHVIKRTPEGKQVREIYLTFIMIAALIMVFVGDFTWGIFLPGALMMGSIIPEGPPLGSFLVEKYELLIMEFFLPFFFVQVGYLTDVNAIKSRTTLESMVLLICVCYLAKIMAVLLASRFVNIRFLNALLIGIILNFKGVFELSVYERWLTRGVVDKQCYTILVLFSICFIAISSPLVGIFYNPQIRLCKYYSKTRYPRNIRTTPPNVELRILISIYDEHDVHDMINFLQALNPSAISPFYSYIIHAVELIGASAPSLIPYKGKAKASKDQYYSEHIFRAFINYSKNSGGLVLVEPLTLVAPFKTMHNIICNFAEDKQVPFIVVPFHKNNQDKHLKQGTHPLRDFNLRLLETSPCTVGFWIRKGTADIRGAKSERTSWKIVVLFIGGVDDREALSLALRISRHQSVYTTLLIVDTGIKLQEIDPTENVLNEMTVNDFLEENEYNERMSSQCVEAKDSLQLMELIRQMESSHDLVIVGRNSAKHVKYEKELMEWAENPELGLIGDMFASSDDNSARSLSILVVQHYKAIDLTKASSSKGGSSMWI